MDADILLLCVLGLWADARIVGIVVVGVVSEICGGKWWSVVVGVVGVGILDRQNIGLALAMAVIIAKPKGNFSKSLNWYCIAYFASDFFKQVTIQNLLCTCLLTIHILPKDYHLSQLLIPWVFFLYSLHTHLYLQIFQQPNCLILISFSIGLCISTSFAFSYFSSSSSNPAILRKLFHLPAIFLIPVGQLLSPKLLIIQLFGCYFILQYVEFIRQWLVVKESRLAVLFERMKPALDQRDQEEWYTHLSLILGYVYPCTKGLPYIAVLFVIADAMAAIIGKHIGGKKLPFQQNRTFSGSMAFFITSMILGTSFNLQLFPLLLSCLSGMILQAYTSLLDNLIVPIQMTHIYLIFQY